ncbi:MAG TPA: XRE family transcriptional regulator [Actinoplanes sp.]|nr:XRE family transcriptional regulator [Actinoplanes sp.]
MTDDPALSADPASVDSAGPRRRSTEGAAVSAAVARHVRALRQARNWSLDELAGRSGVSRGMVVQIEGDRTNPSIGTLCRLAEAFGVNLAALLEPPAQPRVRLIGADEPPVLWRGADGGTGRLLGGVDEVELWDWRMLPGERLVSGDHSPGTRELVHVRVGETVVTVDGVDHRVAEGETLDFAADRPHGYRNDGDVPAVSTMVVVTPSGERDRRGRG